MIVVVTSTSVSIPGGEGRGTPISKGRGCMSYLQGVKKNKQFWYCLGCSASKGSQQELSRYLLGIVLKKCHRRYCVVLGLVPQRGKKLVQVNRISFPFKGSFQNFQSAPSSFEHVNGVLLF